jgi:hypothetical protein
LDDECETREEDDADNAERKEVDWFDIDTAVSDWSSATINSS